MAAHPESHSAATTDDSVLMLIQGRIKPYASAAYQAYNDATSRLMHKYRGEVVTMGGGIESSLTTADWPVTALIRFPNLRSAEGYLSDPVYRKIDSTYRDAAYDDLQISLMAPRPAELRSSFRR
jgi:uncharacterized protein (DUF1330 family)